MAWERVQPRSGMKVGPNARVRMGIEKSGNRTSDKTAVRFSIAADIGRRLGWDRSNRVVLERNLETRQMRISLAGPDVPPEETYKLTGTTRNSDTLTFRVGLGSLRIFSERPLTPIAPVEHVEQDGAIIVTPPGWAWDDYFTGNHEMTAEEAAAIDPPPPVVAIVKAAATLASVTPAKREPVVAMPLRGRGSAVHAFCPPLEDCLEAEDKLAAGSGAKAIADWFGWDLAFAQDYAAAWREATSRKTGRAA